MAFSRRTLTEGIDLYLGKSEEVMDHLREKGQMVDFVLSDPPYGQDYVNAAGERLQNDDAPPLWCVPMMADLLKPDAAMCIFSSPREELLGQWMQAMLDAGLTLPYAPLIWHKVYGGTRSDRYFSSPRAHEMIIRGHKGKPPRRRWKDSGRYIPHKPGAELSHLNDGHIWTEPVPRYKRNRRHPTPKPPGVMERAMWHYTALNDVVLDPFMGSGPVGVAAVRRGCRYIGVELERKYFNLAVENIQRELARQRTMEVLAVSATRALTGDADDEPVVGADLASTTLSA